MNIQALGGTLILGALLTVALLPNRSLAQTNDAAVSAPHSVSPIPGELRRNIATGAFAAESIRTMEAGESAHRNGIRRLM